MLYFKFVKEQVFVKNAWATTHSLLIIQVLVQINSKQVQFYLPTKFVGT